MRQGLPQQAAVFSVILLIAHSLGCDESFNPSAPFVPRMIVYSVLTTQSDTQFVRIYASYNPEENKPASNPEELPVTDAVVTISDGTTTYTFRDTSIARPDTSRYKTPIHLYYCYPMVAEQNKQYTIEATSLTYGTVTSTTIVPDAGPVSIISSPILNNPLNFINQSITVNYSLSPNTGGRLIRFYIAFTAENPWEPAETRYNEKYFEVPTLRVSLNPSYQECEIRYPQISGRTSNQSGHSSQGPQPSKFAFRNKSYRESIVRIQQSNNNVKFKRAVFYVVQFDRPWYIYYAKAHLPENKYGVRLDEPYYTNINGGAGVFGSIRVDSAVVALGESLSAFDPFESPQLVFCSQEVPPLPQPLGDLRKLMVRP